MICLSVHKNGAFVCNAGMPDATLLAAHVRASRFEAAAAFNLSGMQELPGQRSAHVDWVRDSLLKPGDSLVFILLGHATPDAPVMVKPTDSAAYLQEQREYDAYLQGRAGPQALLAQLQSELSFKLAVREQEILVRVPQQHAHMLCMLAWDKWTPELCRVSVSSAPAAASAAGADAMQWLDTTLALGESFEITVMA